MDPVFWTTAALTSAQVQGNDVVAKVQTAKGAETISAEMMLVAVGRAPVTANLGLEALGIAIDKQGFVAVDALMRTAVPHIYAIGDIVRTPQLAHTIHAHPTLPEAVLEAAHGALGRPIHL